MRKINWICIASGFMILMLFSNLSWADYNCPGQWQLNGGMPQYARANVDVTPGQTYLFSETNPSSTVIIQGCSNQPGGVTSLDVGYNVTCVASDNTITITLNGMQGLADGMCSIADADKINK
jgi:hypothetical protein